MDISNDEIRRQLRDVQRDHDAALPTVATALDQAFDPSSGVTEVEKAALLGVPSRRGFLRMGGVAIASSALIAACVNPREEEALPVTGTLPTPPSTSKAPNPSSPELDAALVLTALSLENLAVQTYGAAVDAGWVSGVVADVAKYFSSQHEDHAGLLRRTARDLGQSPNDDPNAYLKTNVVDPEVEAIKALGEAERLPAVLKLAMDLEDMAAQTYTEAGSLLSTAELRQAIMSIGGIEARHYSVLAWVAAQPMVPFALGHTNSAVPEDAIIRPATTTGTTR